VSLAYSVDEEDKSKKYGRECRVEKDRCITGEYTCNVYNIPSIFVAG